MPDGDTIQFKAVVPCDVETLRANVDHALSLGFPSVNYGTINIYANGPSLKDAPVNYPCMALNGAIERVAGPTYWAACDPQELVSKWVPEAGFYTKLLLASKCHPAVFKAARGFDVQVWHLGDESTDHLEGVPKVPTGVSVTLCAIGLAHMMGYRDIHVYGWDGCYDDEGNSHASPQGHSRDGDVEIEIGSGPQKRVFKTTHSWALEAQNAVNYVQQFDGLRLTVHGDGLMANVLGRM